MGSLPSLLSFRKGSPTVKNQRYRMKIVSMITK